MTSRDIIIALFLTMVAAIQGWLCVDGGIALPYVVALGAGVTAAAAVAIMALDTMHRRFRGPTRAQIAEALDLLRARLADDSHRDAMVGRLARAATVLAADDELHAIEARVAALGAELETLDGLAERLPAWRDQIDLWQTRVRHAAPDFVMTDPVIVSPVAAQQARRHIPFNKNLSSADLKLATAFFQLRLAFADWRSDYAEYRDRLIDFGDGR